MVTAPSELPAHQRLLLLRTRCCGSRPHSARGQHGVTRKGVFHRLGPEWAKGRNGMGQRGVGGAGIDEERGREVGLQPGWSGVWVG